MKQGCGIHVKEHRGGVLPQLSPWSPSPGWSWGQGVPPHVCSTLRHLWSYWQLTFLSPAFQMYICNGKRITINFQLVSCFPDYIKAHTVWPAHLENRKQYHSKFSSLLLSTCLMKAFMYRSFWWWPEIIWKVCSRRDPSSSNCPIPWPYYNLHNEALSGTHSYLAWTVPFSHSERSRM